MRSRAKTPHLYATAPLHLYLLVLVPGPPAAMKLCLLLLALALGSAAAAPLPAFNKLKNAGAPEFLQGLFVADKLAGAEDNETSLATLLFTNTPWQVSQDSFYPAAEEEEERRTHINSFFTSWQCYQDDGTPELAGSILFISEGSKTDANGKTGDKQEWCWLLSFGEDGKTVRKHIQRAVNSQSSEQGGYNTDCPGRLHGGAILFPTNYTLVPTSAFPSGVGENPCAKA